MRSDPLRTTVVALMLIAGLGFAAAQTVNPPKNDDAMKTESGKAGTTEPSSHSPSAPPENVPLWNGAPAVPGAKAEGDMVPAKFSVKNDADDKLPTWGYTFKHLSAAQKRAIYETVKKAGPVAPDAIESLGAEVPRTLDLSVLPSDVTAQIPETKSYRYVTTQTKVLLVNPLHRVVVEVLAE